jgi:hypothetical protein
MKLAASPLIGYNCNCCYTLDSFEQAVADKDLAFFLEEALHLDISFVTTVLGN